MNKQEFLSSLQDALAGLPRQDRDRTLDFYREMIDDRLEEGLSESEAITGIGTPQEVAAQVLSEMPPAKAKPRAAGKLWIILLLILGAPLWLPLLIAAAAVLLSVLIVLLATALALALSGIGSILIAIFLLCLWKPLRAIFCLGIGLLCLGLAIPFFFLCHLTIKGLWRLMKKPFQRKEQIR